LAVFLALIWQLSYVHLVAASRAYLLLLAIVAVEIVAVTIAATRSPDVIAWTAAVGAATGAVFQYVGARAIARWSPPLSELRPHEEIAAATRLPAQDVELSMILPCYNPGRGLRVFLERLTAELEGGIPYEIIVVSDGSTDDTVKMAQRFPSPCVRVIHYADRSGKGHALRVGLSAARGAFVGFIDADGDIDPHAIGPFLSLMNLYGPDIVLGSKRHPMSQVSYPPLRRAMSWIYHKLTRVLFRINVRDTQTGLKLVRGDVLASVLPRIFEKRYAFDLELLVVARMLGFTNVFEAPVRIDYRFSSNVDPGAVVGILVDTAAIFFRRYILDTYRHAGDRLLIVRSDPEAD
jgi:glycosyltransferase involved in cell wall biosynthesis